MNPGLVVKLRPAGPWRIGPDSGARNRVDFIYHSDSLYSAVTSAMARLGSLDPWLDATARRPEGAPAVCFSSCFPFLDEIGFVVPPRTVWPPVSRALVSARVRWKSARFVPLGVVQAILAGQRLDENHWSVDGPSECLVPAGLSGPFRTGVRWSAAVDRLTGSTERHSAACIEFRPGAGLWTVVSFADESAHARWLQPVKAAFRLLADTGFGGERSRGWGRAESPEFIDGTLPDMILPPAVPTEQPLEQAAEQPGEQPLGQVPDLAVKETAPPVSEQPVSASDSGAESAAEATLPTEDPEPLSPVTEPPSELPPVEEPSSEPDEPTAAMAAVKAPSDLEPLAADLSPLPPPEPEPPVSDPALPILEGSPSTSEPTPPIAETGQPVESERGAPEPASSEPVASAPPEPESEPVPELPTQEPAAPVEPVASPASEAAAPTPNPQPPTPDVAAPAPGPRPPAPDVHPHWLLSLFTPATDDAVDWRRGNYTVLARGGRVDSPAGSGELKKQIQMVAEGSVVYAPAGPCGAAADVAPDGFAHPVFRAGFAVSIPLPEVS